MPHRYPIREIARQAGVSDATVDRVLHGRAGVRAGTAGLVHQAIRDLDAQRTQLELAGRRFMVDVVVDAPTRFTAAVRQGLEAALPGLRPAVFRARFSFQERWDPDGCAAVLRRIAARGTQGVILKAPDVPVVSTAVAELEAAGIPVVTLVTDLPDSPRRAYVGFDNRAAGATAAYLVEQWMRGRPGSVAVVVSNDWFHGEEQRGDGFRSTLRALDPERTVLDLPGGDGLDRTTRDLFRRALTEHPELDAVYSVGGGNHGIMAAFDDAGRAPRVVVGHDLAPENVELLRAGRIHAVLHHDLEQDLQRCCRIVMEAHGAIPPEERRHHSTIDVITPYNVPAGL
ncbi:LacI family DNA-binding transcriptional regulator [Kocuria arenosa]|uniref:LacI family DNA-binding transcriptional regulator n=1 Tax=Kocuria arenosa TaxID=3071446 RepID=UPI0034D5B32A